MKNFLTLSCVVMLTGCVGLSVGSFGTAVQVQEEVVLKDQRNGFDYTAKKAEPVGKDHLLEMWGEPDEKLTREGCEVWSYHHGWTWAGVSAYVLVVPIPLGVPTGHAEQRFYFKDGEHLALVSEYTSEKFNLGYMCGEIQCGFLAGKVSSTTGLPIKDDSQRIPSCM